MAQWGNLQSHLQGFQELLNALDEIRTLIGSNDHAIEIPKVVVIGDQSHGKSSLMELISGIDLPRNPGICTRVPCELRLRQCNAQHPRRSVFISAEHKERHEIKFEAIADMVEQYSEQLVQGDEAVADKPITLTIYDVKLPNLTLIDLPGLVHNDPDPKKIQAIRNISKRYILSDQSIIVNVLNCSNEAANAESLRLSTEVDGKRERTLLALTKIDLFADTGLVEKYEDFVSKENFPNSRIFLVRNRTNKENTDKVALSQVQLNEKHYLQTRVDLADIPDKSKGSSALTQVLVQIQQKKMVEIIPDLKREIARKVTLLEEEEKTFVTLPSEARECKRSFRAIVQQLLDKLKLLIKGELDYNHTKQYICAKTMELSEQYCATVRLISANSDFISDEFLASLKDKNDKIRGFESFPHEVHQSVVVQVYRELLDKIKAPSVALIDDTRDYLEAVLREELAECAKQYPRLRSALLPEVDDMLRRCHEQAKKAVLDYIHMECTTRPFTQQSYRTKALRLEQAIANDEKNGGGGHRFQVDGHAQCLVVQGSDNEQVNGSYKLQDSKVNERVWYKSDKGMSIQYRHVHENTSSMHWEFRRMVVGADNGSIKVPDVAVDEKEAAAESLKRDLPRSNEGQANPMICSSGSWQHAKPGLKLVALECLFVKQYRLMDHKEQGLVKQAIKIAAFWECVMIRICDIVPMLIFHNMVEMLLVPSYQNKMYESCDELDEDGWKLLFTVDDHLMQRMQRNRVQLQNSRKARDLLFQIPKM